MNSIPNIDEIISVKPEISSLEYVDKGGFKVVYKGIISGQEEAIKTDIFAFRRCGVWKAK